MNNSAVKSGKPTHFYNRRSKEGQQLADSGNLVITKITAPAPKKAQQVSTGVQISQDSDSHLLDCSLTGTGTNNYSLMQEKKHKKSPFGTIEYYRPPQSININLVTAREAEDFIV